MLLRRELVLLNLVLLPQGRERLLKRWVEDLPIEILLGDVFVALPMCDEFFEHAFLHSRIVRAFLHGLLPDKSYRAIVVWFSAFPMALGELFVASDAQAVQYVFPHSMLIPGQSFELLGLDPTNLNREATLIMPVPPLARRIGLSRGLITVARV